MNVSALGVQSLRAVNDDTIVVGCGNGFLSTFTIGETKIIPKKATQVSGGITSLSVALDGEEILAATNKGFIYRVNEETMEASL